MHAQKRWTIAVGRPPPPPKPAASLSSSSPATRHRARSLPRDFASRRPVCTPRCPSSDVPGPARERFDRQRFFSLVFSSVVGVSVSTNDGFLSSSVSHVLLFIIKYIVLFSPTCPTKPKRKSCSSDDQSTITPRRTLRYFINRFDD